MPRTNSKSKSRRRSRRTMRGGSPASDRVMSFVTGPSPLHNNVVSPRIPGNVNSLNLYQTTGGGRRRRRRRSRRRTRRRTRRNVRRNTRRRTRRKRRRRRRRRQRGGGSDWAQTLYSRGPLSTPDRPGQFSAFTQDTPFVSNQDLYYQGLGGCELAGAPISGGGKRRRSRRRRRSAKKSMKGGSPASQRVMASLQNPVNNYDGINLYQESFPSYKNVCNSV